MYRLIQANTTTFLNLHLTMKTEKHGISLLSRKISADRQLVPVHNTTHGNSGSSSLVPGQPHYLFETLPAMCRNTPGVPLFLQDERTERGGWQGKSSQKDALQRGCPPMSGVAQLSHTQSAGGPAALRHRSGSAPDVDAASASKAF